MKVYWRLPMSSTSGTGTILFLLSWWTTGQQRNRYNMDRLDQTKDLVLSFRLVYWTTH